MTQTPAPRRILVVDDEHNLRISLATTLHAEGYEVVQAQDGQEALERLEAQTFDLILTDIRMPRRSGIELFHQVRQRHPSIPVVMMTAFANEHLIEDALAAGVFTVIDKPFDMAPMLNLVASVVQNPVVLVVDQFASEAEAIVKALRGVGLRAEAALDVTAATALLRERQVDACVLDLEMADGLLLAQSMDDQLPAVRFIAITGPQGADVLQRAGHLAGETCLRRPLVMPELVRAIARARQAAMQQPLPAVDSHEKMRRELRHDLNNRLLVIRASAYYLQRVVQRTDLWTQNPQVPQMFTLIDEAIKGSVALLESQKKSAASVPPAPVSLSATSPVAAPPRLLPAELLIVDDNRNNRWALQSVLEGEGLAVDAAESSADARARLLSPDYRYRLVILDKHLGDGLGTELVPLIRQHQPLARILLLSGSAPQEPVDPVGAGVDAHLPKGQDINNLLAVVAELLM